MINILLGVISCQDKIEAEMIGTLLLKKHLAACIQIIPAIDSAFLWPPGKNIIDTKQEAVLLVKTLETTWSLLELEVQKIHSYQTPEILGLSVAHVNKAYLNWLTKELS